MSEVRGGEGTALFSAGGSWEVPRDVVGAPGPRTPGLLLQEPERVLTATTAAAIPELLAAVDEEQARGRYVAGYLAYEAGAAFGLPVKETAVRAVPDCGGTLGGPVEIEPGSAALAWMAVYGPEQVRPFDGRVGDRDDTASFTVAGREPSPLELNVGCEEYARGIRAVREYIAAGDTYQVNYTVRARFDLGSDPLHYFLERSEHHPVPYGAYLDLGPSQVISLSPELFLRRRGETLESRPMKGTRPRAAAAAADVDLAQELIRSQKDRAEDLMIVDMMRNDIGRVCRPGTVSVPALFTVEPYGTVWQMSSAVVGRLPAGVGVSRIMEATFPGASITGAPKHHTMEIIRELETEARGVYTGMLGLFLPGGDFTCNLCIRTILHRDGRCLLGVGSGVVWDSDPREEYDETITKASFAFPRAVPGTPAPHARTNAAVPRVDAGAARPPVDLQARAPEGLTLFETILLDAVSNERRDGQAMRYRDLEAHLARMDSSALALGLPFDEQAARNALSTLAAGTPCATVVRLESSQAGDITIATRPVPGSPPSPVTVALSPFRTDPDDGLLRHKTTVRPLYDLEYRRAQEQGFFEILFLNRLDDVTEGAITNVFARTGTRWVTPPLDDGLLPGIWRARFLAGERCVEDHLTVADLLAADEVVIANSIRGPIRVGTIVPDALGGLVD